MKFISTTNKEMHKEYLRELKLKMSIFEKSYPQIAAKSCRDILRSRLDRKERERAAALKAEILAHELYFSSFGMPNTSSKLIRQHYGSEANFLYNISRDAINSDGFLFVFIDSHGVPIWRSSREYTHLVCECHPILALDLFEHAYFFDYSFNKDAYIKNAVFNLDLSKIDL